MKKLSDKEIDSLSKEEVKKLVKNLQNVVENQASFGLIWDKEIEPEKSAELCKAGIPLLEESSASRLSSKGVSNVLIEGDNLHALSALSLVLQDGKGDGTIDVIYIDPPYNTGHDDFSYNDKFVDEDDKYPHSKWLSTISKRLTIAKDLLSEDGVIFINIGDQEQADLKLLCDSVFGPDNWITTFIWEKTQHFGRQTLNCYSDCDYILCYAKKLHEDGEKRLLVESINANLLDAPLYNASNNENTLIFPAGSVKFNIPDGEYSSASTEKYVLVSPVSVKNGTNNNELILRFRSRWSPSTVIEENKKGTTFWVKTESFAIRAIYHEGKTGVTAPKQIIFTNENNPFCAHTKTGEKVGVNETGSKEVENILGPDAFSYPKPKALIKYLIGLYYDWRKNEYPKNITVMDFYAGSGTTGQAVLEMNSEDGGNRRFVLITDNSVSYEKENAFLTSKGLLGPMPESKKSEAYKEWKKKRDSIDTSYRKTEDFQKMGICEAVCYPRLKTIITGKRQDGTTYGQPIDEGLSFFKTSFLSLSEEGQEKSPDDIKAELAEKCSELLSIKEECPECIEKTKDSAIYSDGANKKRIFIFFGLGAQEEIVERRKELEDFDGQKVVYEFSFDDQADEELIKGIKNCVIKAIPTKMLQKYKDVIKRMEAK
jgi:16S rRNA G966 N2-methylase RsmD